jgi:hypothetical protein
VDGTYILEVYKDDKKGDTKATIVMDLCDKVIRVNIFDYLLYILLIQKVFLYYNVFTFLE